MDLVEAKEKLAGYAENGEDHSIGIKLTSWWDNPCYELYLNRRGLTGSYASTVSFEDVFDRLDKDIKKKQRQPDIWDLM